MLHSSEILGRLKIKNQFPDPKKVSEKGVDEIVYILVFAILDDWHSQESNTFIDWETKNVQQKNI